MQVASFVLRLYSDINYAFIGIMTYTVAITLSLYIMYSLHVRWTRIADTYYGQNWFYKGWGGITASVILTIIFLGCIVISVWVSSIMWLIAFALYFILWIMMIVALVRHRRHTPSHTEKTIYMSMMEKKYNLVQIATSHKLIDNMAVFLVVTAAIQIVKLIFLVLCYVFIPLFFIAPLYYMFCITPDLAFAIFLANTETVTLFEPSRHVPSARNDIAGYGTPGIPSHERSDMPESANQHMQPVMNSDQVPYGSVYNTGTFPHGHAGEVVPVRSGAPPPLDSEPTEVTVMPV